MGFFLQQKDMEAASSASKWLSKGLGSSNRAGKGGGEGKQLFQDPPILALDRGRFHVSLEKKRKCVNVCCNL